VTFGVVFALACAEGVVRIFDPYVRDMVVPAALVRVDPALGWAFASGTRARHQTRYFDVTYTINDQGFRDGDRVRSKPPGTHRVVLYGDSLVFGWGLHDGERFSDLLERNNPTLEIWNHAIPGYGLDQEILAYQKEGDVVDADEVMLFVGVSTLSRVHAKYIYAKYKPVFEASDDGRLTLVPVSRAKNTAFSVFYRLLSPFYLPYFLQSRLANIQATLKPREALDLSDAKTANGRQYIGEFEALLLGEALASVRRHNSTLSVLAANLLPDDRSRLRALCARMQIGYVEIGPGITATATTDERDGLVFGKHDKHWNARASALIADELAPQLRVTSSPSY
jgi:hypothetical protein